MSIWCWTPPPSLSYSFSSSLSDPYDAGSWIRTSSLHQTMPSQHTDFYAMNCLFWEYFPGFRLRDDWLRRHHHHHHHQTPPPPPAASPPHTAPLFSPMQLQDAQLQFGRGAVTSPPAPSQSHPLIILSNTYCLCTGRHFGCSHWKSSLSRPLPVPTRWEARTWNQSSPSRLWTAAVKGHFDKLFPECTEHRVSVWNSQEQPQKDRGTLSQSLHQTGRFGNGLTCVTLCTLISALFHFIKRN